MINHTKGVYDNNIKYGNQSKPVKVLVIMSLSGFGPYDWDLGLVTRIWASRLGFEGGDGEEEGGGEGGEEEGEYSPYV